MKTAYLRREGPDKLQQVRRESRTGHLIRGTLSLSHTHSFSSYTASSKNKAALHLSTLCLSLSLFLLSSFPLSCFLYTLYAIISCLCIDVEWHCQVISVSFNQNPLYNCLAGGPEVDLLSSQLSLSSAIALSVI